MGREPVTSPVGLFGPWWVTHLDYLNPGEHKLKGGLWVRKIPYVYVVDTCWIDCFVYGTKNSLYPLRIKK